MRVLLADDHKMLRDGLRSVLESAGLGVVGEAGDGREAIAEAERLRPDAVVMDISMPGLNGVDATRRLTSSLPSAKVLALSMSADEHYVLAMLSAGASAYLVKNSAAAELVTALAAVGRGETYLSSTIARGVIAHVLHGVRGAVAPEQPLSLREREVLQLIAEGKASKEISSKLGIAVPTVETHRRQIGRKLGLRTIAELTKYAIREGLTTAES